MSAFRVGQELVRGLAAGITSREICIQTLISARRAHKDFMEYKRRLGNRPHDPALFWSILKLQMNRHRWRRMAALLTLAVAGVAVICQ